jgi:NDP-sugar pyrophosphorylase family protein
MFKPEETTVFILAAGLGTRLKPITNTVPKVMVEVEPDMPLLLHTLLGLKCQGFSKFVFNLHYLPGVIREYFGSGEKWGVDIKYSDESECLLDTAGAIKKAAPLLSDPFVLLYGDQLHTFNLLELAKKHESAGADITLLLKRSDLPQNGDLARIDAEGNIKEWIPRPHSYKEFESNMYLNTGAYVINKQLISLISDGPVSLDKEVIPSLFSSLRPIAAVVYNGEVLDIGTPEKLEYAKEWLKKRKEIINNWRGTRYVT